MYECLGCGGDLRFDIATQQLKCNHCNNVYDPYEREQMTDAIENTVPGEYQVTVFSCPECGAEIESTNLTAAGFCSYCGGATILSGRVKNEKRPQRIIPFRVTKEDCKRAYAQTMKKQLFAPKELKSPEYLERFIGFYLPYWSFDSELHRELSLDGSRSYRRGNYRYTDMYQLNGRLDAGYQGLSYDASSSFDDAISEGIAPYFSEDVREFTPSYLLGFYADTSDVPMEAYKDDAETEILRDIEGKLYSRSYDGISPARKNERELRDRLGLSAIAYRAMFPVWFMTYRNKDRVAYSVVNGQTGRVYADVPVDLPRFYGISLLLAVPIFFAANLFVSLKAQEILMLTAVLSLLSSILYIAELGKIERREKRTEDQGFQWRDPDSAEARATMKNAYGKGGTPEKKGSSLFSILILIFVFGQIGLGVLFAIAEFFGAVFRNAYAPLSLLLLLGTGAMTAVLVSKARRLKSEKTPEAAGALAAAVLAALISFWNPVDDLYYYLGAIASFLGIAYTIFGIIRKYNLFATRPIPEFFDRRGADDRA